MPSAVPTGGLRLGGCCGGCRALWGCSGPLLPAYPPHPSPLCPVPYPGGPGQAAAERREGGRGAQGPPNSPLPCCRGEAAWMVTGAMEPGAARHCPRPYGCSRAPWHSPQQILLVRLHPLSCLFDVGLASVPAPVPIPTASSHGQAVVDVLALSRRDHSSRTGHRGYICSLVVRHQAQNSLHSCH